MSTTKIYEGILEELKQVQSLEGGEIILISKDSKDNKMKILFSSLAISEYQKQSIKGVLENSSLPMSNSNICTIKPALKFHRSLKLSRKSVVDLTNHYKDLLVCLSQAICKEVAKQWIKIAEPNKQALYPYKYFNESKPPWWPSCVNHIEPDHLDKYGRIKVLINILRNPDFPLETLRIRTKVLTFKNLIVHNILDELYYVAAYDRLFYDQFRNKSNLFQNILEEDKDCFLQDVITLEVSDLNASNFLPKKAGIIMVSQLKKEYMNQISYSLSKISGNFSNSIEKYIKIEENTIKDIKNEEITTPKSNENEGLNYQLQRFEQSKSKECTNDPTKSEISSPTNEKTNVKDSTSKIDDNNYLNKNGRERLLSRCQIYEVSNKKSYNNKYPLSKRAINTCNSDKNNIKYYDDAKLSFVEKYNEYIKRKHNEDLNRNQLKRNIEETDPEEIKTEKVKMVHKELIDFPLFFNSQEELDSKYKFSDFNFDTEKNQEISNLLDNANSPTIKDLSSQISDNSYLRGSSESFNCNIFDT